jgi:hypothetical protein
MTTNLNTIDDLIEFIDTNNLNDYAKINEMCDAMFSKTFFGLQFGDTPHTKHYYINHLQSFRNEINIHGCSKRFFINFPHPFSIKEFI